jgi:hypothetical protein
MDKDTITNLIISRITTISNSITTIIATIPTMDNPIMDNPTMDNKTITPITIIHKATPTKVTLTITLTPTNPIPINTTITQII